MTIRPQLDDPVGSTSATRMAGNGAQRKNVLSLIYFLSPLESGHSRDGRMTARFAPLLTLLFIVMDDLAGR
jgi:hypothetical protein